MNTSMYIMYAGLSANLHLKWITCLKYSNVVHQFICMHTNPCICKHYNVYNILGIQYGVPSFKVVKNTLKYLIIDVFPLEGQKQILRFIFKSNKILNPNKHVFSCVWLVGWLVDFPVQHFTFRNFCSNLKQYLICSHLQLDLEEEVLLLPMLQLFQNRPIPRPEAFLG